MGKAAISQERLSYEGTEDSEAAPTGFRHTHDGEDLAMATSASSAAEAVGLAEVRMNRIVEPHEFRDARHTVLDREVGAIADPVSLDAFGDEMTRGFCDGQGCGKSRRFTWLRTWRTVATRPQYSRLALGAVDVEG